MILKAKYVGPFPEVTVPGFSRKHAKPGEVVTLRVPDGFPLGGCWEITEGAKEYQAGLEKAEADRIAKHKAKDEQSKDRLKKAEKKLPSELDHYLANGEADHTKTKATKTAKTGGSK